MSDRQPDDSWKNENTSEATNGLSQPASPGPPWLLTPVPVNLRVAVYAYAMGCLLSVPIAGVMIGFNLRPFVPPDWTAPFYGYSLLASVLIFPFWCGLALRDVPVLKQLGFTFFAFYLVIIVLGSLLFPAVQSAAG
ncbi:hypothetical protein BH09VER1_BH09VER1_44480 [soil metagenome]